MCLQKPYFVVDERCSEKRCYEKTYHSYDCGHVLEGVTGAVALLNYAAKNTDTLATAPLVLERKENMMSGVVTRTSWCDRGLKRQFSLFV